MSKLFCRACREELNLNLSTIRNHIQSVKHVDGKNKVAKKEAREQDIATALRARNAKEHLVGEHLPDAQQVFHVKVVSAFLRAAGLKEELPTYIAKCIDVGSVSEINWWRMNSEDLPKWSVCVKQIVLIQTSSAAAERVFSFLTSSFTEQQIHSLNVYVEASIMLQYNEC